LKPIFTTIGEGHHEKLDQFIEGALSYYNGRLTTVPLPLSRTEQPVVSKSFSYPGKVTLSPTGMLAIADTGKHRIILVTPEGKLLVRIDLSACNFYYVPFYLSNE